MIEDTKTSAFPPLAEEDYSRWQVLLAQLSPETLTDALLPLVASVPGYESSPVPSAEIRRNAVTSFAALLESLNTGDLRGTASAAVELGVTRARAGVELSSLMTAVRCDLIVLWDGLTCVSEADDAGLIVNCTSVVLEVVEEYVRETQSAYLAEAQRMRNETDFARQALISSLFRGPQPSERHHEEVAQQLGFDHRLPLHVAASTGQEAVSLRVAGADLTRLGFSAHAYENEGALIIFAPCTTGECSSDCPVFRRLATLPVGLMTAWGGTHQLRHVAHVAIELAQLTLVGENKAVTVNRGWVQLAARKLEAEGVDILADINQSLSTMTAFGRQQMLSAVRSFLTTGSIKATANEHYCHRNTVAKRLRQFREATGIDPTVPRQASLLVAGGL